jgi:hypothetical protein
MLKDHATELLQLAPELSAKNPALSTIATRIALEAVLLLELERRGNLNPEIDALNQDIAQGLADANLRIRSRRPSKWSLGQLIEISSRCGLISVEAALVSSGLRNWRNMVHPAVLRVKFPTGIDLTYAEAAIGVSPMILEEVRRRRNP